MGHVANGPWSKLAKEELDLAFEIVCYGQLQDVFYELYTTLERNVSNHKKMSAISLNRSVEPEAVINSPTDVIVTKAFLGKIGYYPDDVFAHTSLTDEKFWESIENFQRRCGLRVDSVIRPGGETARELARQVSDSCPVPDDDSVEERCKHLHYNVDIPVCRAIKRRALRSRRPQERDVARRCYESANRRYAACLLGTPLSQLPPLDTVVW